MSDRRNHDGRLRYAGLNRVQAHGLSVAESALRLRRLAYAEARLMRLFASRMVTIADREVKLLMARLQYEACLHADGLRARSLEMRVAKGRLDEAPDEALAIFFDEAEHLPDPYAFLAVVARVIKPALRQAYRAYLDEANHLADYPSVRLIEQCLADEAEHQALLDLAVNATPATDAEREQARDWQAELARYLNAAGGLDGTAPRAEHRPRRASHVPYRIPHELRRDQAFRRVWDFEKPPYERVADHLNYMMSIRLSEINVAEGLAIVLCETKRMPWRFYADISRHCWDEARHSMFGEAAIEATYGDRAALPMRDYEGVFAMEAPPLEQYAVLGLEVEGKNMKYPPGKRLEWEFCRDSARHALMTTFQDFDWADEVLHVNIARRQLDQWFEGGLERIAPFSTAGKEHRAAVKQRHAPTPVVPIVAASASASDGGDAEHR